MNTYTLANPHDNYSFEAPDDNVATVVVSILGRMYGWECEDRTGGFGALLLPDSDAYKDTLATVKAVLDTRRKDVAAAMETVEIEGERRRRLGVDPEKWHDEMRSSATDLRAAAQHFAAKLREPR